jgi:hypothetical protein
VFLAVLIINPLNAKLNPICRFLALLGAHPILHISRVRVNPRLEEKIMCCRSEFTVNSVIIVCKGSSVGIVTGYGLDGPAIESRWGRDFPHVSRPALGLTQPPVQWVPGLSRGKERPGRDADPSPPSSAVVMKG